MIRARVLRCSIAALALLAAPAAAQAPGGLPCGAHAEIAAALVEMYGEARQGAGLAGTSHLYEIWASDETGTWTILRVTADGRACVMAVGQHWSGAASPSPGQRSGLAVPGGFTSLARPGVRLPRVPSPRAHPSARDLRPGWLVARPLFSGGGS